jgi:ArsR family transcriptional regulator
LPVLDCAPLFSGAPLDEAAASRMAAALRVLADPGRPRILSLVRAQLDREACVCHLTEALGLSQPTVSHHLKVLYDAGLLERERRGTRVYYRIVRGAVGRQNSTLTASLSMLLKPMCSASSFAAPHPQRMTVAQVTALYLARGTDASGLGRALLASALPEGWRAEFRHRLQL